MSLQTEMPIGKQLVSGFDEPLHSVTEAWLEKRIRLGQKAIFAENVTLTPDLARVLLARNEANRTLKHSILSDLIHDIRAGAWQMNGETIIVSKDGKLNDGQHRCAAVDKTGMSVDTIITFGVSRESRSTVDTGGKKSVGDFIVMGGGTNGNLYAVIAKMIWQYEKYGHVVQRPDMRPTSAETQQTFWEHERAIDAAFKATLGAGSAKLGHLSMVAFAMLLLRRKNEDAAKIYMDALCKGSSLSETSPIYQARERLSDPASRRLKVGERLEIILRHWNAWRRNQKMRKPSPLQGTLPEIEA